MLNQSEAARHDTYTSQHKHPVTGSCKDLHMQIKPSRKTKGGQTIKMLHVCFVLNCNCFKLKAEKHWAESSGDVLAGPHICWRCRCFSYDLINLPVSKWMSVLCLTSSSAPSSPRIVISTREPSNQTTHTWICVWWGTSSMCGQFSMFPAEPDLGQPHTEPGFCVSHWARGAVVVSGEEWVCVCDCDWSYHTHRQGQLCSLRVQGKHLSVIAHIGVCTSTVSAAVMWKHNVKWVDL